MNTFFTSDTHFYHANIIKYCNRPFQDSIEMNETIINNWNSVVKAEDLVYHLGDFILGNRREKQRNNILFGEIFRRLNGTIVLIKGNHDQIAWDNRRRFYASYDGFHEIEIDNKEITLCHYPMTSWHDSHYGAWNLFGHVHGTLVDDPHSLKIDVGVDCHNFKPISFEEVKVIMSKKFFQPLNRNLKQEGQGLSTKDFAKAERRRLYEQLKQEFNEKEEKEKIIS